MIIIITCLLTRIERLSGHSQPICDPPGAFPAEISFMQRHSPAEAPSSASSSAAAAAAQRPPPAQKASSVSSEARRPSPTGSVASSQSQAVTPSRQLSDGEKLKKCILELVETERTYVKVISTSSRSMRRFADTGATFKPLVSKKKIKILAVI